MSQTEQSRLFIKGLSTDLWHKISTRLSIKEPDHDPNNFCPSEDVRKAGEYVLNRTNPPVLLMGMGISSNPSFSSGLMAGANNASENVVKKEACLRSSLSNWLAHWQPKILISHLLAIMVVLPLKGIDIFAAQFHISYQHVI